MQLAVNKTGTLAGNYSDLISGTTRPIQGAVDKKTQRVAWTIGNNKHTVGETGLYNLTKDEAPALIHIGKDKTEQWLLVRLKQPAQGGGAKYAHLGRLSGIRMAMNRWLALAAMLEAVTGLRILALPSLVVRLLLGGEIAGPSLALGRVAGMALLSLGVACLPGPNAAGNTAPALRAMLTYNTLATLYFLYLGIAGKWVGPLLWPAVALHGILLLLLARQWWLRGS